MADVPCRGCTACCQHDLILIYPEHGDIAGLYETVEAIDPLTGKPARAVARKPTGECLYLGERGCTIHEYAPRVCREFDCGLMYARLSRPDRRRMIKAGLAGADVLAQGFRVQRERGSVK